MAATAGLLAIKSRFDSGGLGKGFRQGAKDAKNFKSVTQTAATAVSGLALKMAAIIGPFLAFKSIISGVSDAMSELDNLGKTVDALGFQDVNDLRGLQFAAEQSGVKVEVLEKALQRLVRRLGEAKGGFGEGRKALESLGLKASEVAQLDTFSAFKKVADAISQQGSAAEQAAAAYGLFGRQGIELINMLKTGSIGIDAFKARIIELGGNLNRFDIAQVELANDSLNELKHTFSAIYQQIAVNLSPIIVGMVRSFQDLGFTGKDAGDFIFDAFETIGPMLALSADLIQETRLEFKTLQAAFSFGIAAMSKSFALFTGQITDFLNLLPGVNITITETANAVASDLFKLAQEQFAEAKKLGEQPPASDKINKFFNEVRAHSKQAADDMHNVLKPALDEVAMKATESGFKMVESLEMQIKTFGMTSAEAKLYKLAMDGADASVLKMVDSLSRQVAALEEQKKLTEAGDNLLDSLQMQVATFGMSSREAERYKLQLQGVSGAIIDQAKMYDKQLTAMEKAKEKQKELEDSAKRIVDSLKTPFDEFVKGLSELELLLEKKLISRAQFDEAVLKAQKEFENSKFLPETKFNKALDAGSAEARSAILRSRFDGNKKPLDKISENTKAQLVELRQIRRQQEQRDNRQATVIYTIGG